MQATSCPRCGGNDRFYYVARPRNGRAPFWHCNQCHYSESDAQGIGTATATPLFQPSPNDQKAIRHAARLIAIYCADQLFKPVGAQALSYLRKRGFSDATLRQWQIGFSPNIDPKNSYYGVGEWLRQTDPASFDAARLGGLLGPQGRLKTVLRGTITIPYWKDAECWYLRSRSFENTSGPKYLSPSGVEMFWSDTPILYLHNVLATAKEIGVTEGELKPLRAWQHWQEGHLTFPFVGHPGIGYFPEEYLAHFANKKIHLVYDREKRTDPFQPSAGERFTFVNGEKVSAIELEEQIERLQTTLRRTKDPDERDDLQDRIDELTTILLQKRSHKIQVFVSRLPSLTDKDKTDVDEFINSTAPKTLKVLLERSMPFINFYKIHGPSQYSYQHGMIIGSKGLHEPVATYQAIVVEDIAKDDGIETEIFHKLLIRYGGHQETAIEISSEEWADTRSACAALLKGVRSGGADHISSEVIHAIRALSRYGDGPQPKRVYTTTGWRQIGSHWFYLMPDGAIHANGFDHRLKAEVELAQVGDHYSMGGSGDALKGVQALFKLFDGYCGPKHLALFLLAHAALAPIHRFIGDSNRPAPWLWGESGSMTTSFSRLFLSFFGPKFVAPRGDGPPLPKWGNTAFANELTGYVWADTLFMLDDYKRASAKPEVVANWLHNYSEGTSKQRGTKNLRLSRSFPVQGIGLFTGEDWTQQDTGQLARVTLLEVRKGQIDPEHMAEIQDVAASGHFMALMRQFIEDVALTLDTVGPTKFQESLQQLIKDDANRLPGHLRSSGSFRLNRLAFLVFLNWLERAGYCTVDQVKHYDQAYLSAREEQANQQADSIQEQRPSNLFIEGLRQMLAQGIMVLYDPVMGNEGAAPDRVAGFLLDADRLAIFDTVVWENLQYRAYKSGERIQYSLDAVRSQLMGDGLILEVSRGDKYRKVVSSRINGKSCKMLILPSNILN
jgi:DNA primase